MAAATFVELIELHNDANLKNSVALAMCIKTDIMIRKESPQTVYDFGNAILDNYDTYKRRVTMLVIARTRLKDPLSPLATYRHIKTEANADALIILVGKIIDDMTRGAV